MIEFVLGKVLGYHASRHTAQALKAYQVISMLVAWFPSLHLPANVLSSDEERLYFKRMVSFYAGFFSWFDVNFTAILFKRIFVPPRRETM
jgi:hypothetical protein